MHAKNIAEYFILGMPYAMGLVFLVGAFSRIVIWFTVRRHEWFAREFEKRVAKFMDTQVPGEVKDVSFYALTKKVLERSFYESFAVRERMRRRKLDSVMSMSDRVFLIKPGCAWLVKDVLSQIKFIKWTKDTPKLMQLTRATFNHNPCFNRVFGIIPIGSFNELVGILPGLFVIAGILGTFIGIAGGLQELGGMNLQDLDNTKNIMDRFLQEISFAMGTSITGIVFSLATHLINTTFSPDRNFMNVIDRFETALTLLWYRADNNDYPHNAKEFNEHRDPIEALAEDSVDLETKRHPDRRELPEGQTNKAS